MTTALSLSAFHKEFDFDSERIHPLQGTPFQSFTRGVDKKSVVLLVTGDTKLLRKTTPKTLAWV